MKFDAQIAANSVSGGLYFKIFLGGACPPPPPYTPSTPRAFVVPLHDQLIQAGFATRGPGTLSSVKAWPIAPKPGP
jgi:hypothetical protein